MRRYSNSNRPCGLITVSTFEKIRETRKEERERERKRRNNPESSLSITLSINSIFIELLYNRQKMDANR